MRFALAFELKESEYKRKCISHVFLFNVSSCGAVVGVVPFMNTAALIQQLADKMNIKLK